MQLLTILIADDEAPIRFALKHLLSCTGHRVLEASNGFEAMAVLEREHRDGHAVDILLVDMLTPGFTGAEVVERLVAGAQRPRVIFMSGALDVPPTFPDGIFPYLVTLTKPFNCCDLTKHLVRAMELRQGGEETGTKGESET